MPLLMLDMDSEDEEYLPTADPDDAVWSMRCQYWTATNTYVYMRYQTWQPHPTAQSRSASNPTPTTQSRSVRNPPPEPNQGEPAALPPQPDQVEMPPDLIELDIMEDIPDILDVPEEVISDFKAWHTVCWTTHGSMTIYIYSRHY